MDIDQVKAIFGGPTPAVSRPEGPSEVQPLTGHHQARVAAEAAPANVEAAQGAGTPTNSLAPAPGEPADGEAVKGWKGGSYTQDNEAINAGRVGNLAPGPARPEGGEDGQQVVPAAPHDDPALGPRLGSDGTGATGIPPGFRADKSSPLSWPK